MKIDIRIGRKSATRANELVVECSSDGFEPLVISVVTDDPLCDVASRVEQMVHYWAGRAMTAFEHELARRRLPDKYPEAPTGMMMTGAVNCADDIVPPDRTVFGDNVRDSLRR